MAYLEPGTVTHFDVEVEPGAVIIYDVSSDALFTAVFSGEPGPNEPIRARLQDGKLGAEPFLLRPGRFVLDMHNDSDQRRSLVLFNKPQKILDAMQAATAAGESVSQHFDRFLSGRRLLTSHTFRQAFGTETIRTSDGLGVRDISILFTDLKGSTAMYEKVGDLKAFALVNQHFERLGRAVTRHRGAVVKTIGDAVMASFENPVDAVASALDMIAEIATFNREAGEREIVLKVGVHRGASIAVTLNGRLDFFGQTVNIASRVQGLADADEVYLTEEVFRVPGVKEKLAGLDVLTKEETLKGVKRPVTVYRIAPPRDRERA
jgi:class 3 adenylate cyclase